MRDFQVVFLKLFNLGASHSGLRCNLRIKKSAFGTNPIIQYEFYKEIKVVFFLSFISLPQPPRPPGFLTRLVSRINISKPLVSLTKLATGWHKSKSLKSFIKSSALKVWFAEKGFLTSWERSDKEFFSFLMEKNFWPTERILESNRFHFKRFHFKSTSNGWFGNVWWKSRNHPEIRNLSETYLEPNQRYMMVLLFESS